MSDIYPPEMGPTPHGVSPPNEVNLMRATVARRVTLAMLALFLVGTLGLNTYAVVQIRSTQLEGTPTGKKLVASADRILDCTSPKGGAGSCYERSQKQTAAVVGNIASNNILAVVCALQVPDGTPLRPALNQVTTCVQAHQPKAG